MKFNTIEKLKEKYIQNFVFIHINKTAGSSIQQALSIPHEHKTALEKIEHLGMRAWKRKFTFTLVRNPWDKVVSHYHFRLQTNQTNLQEANIDFNTWVKLTYGDMDTKFYDRPKMFMPQTKWISDEKGKILVNYIGKFEQLQSDFSIICERTKTKPIQLPHRKPSKRIDFRTYYDDESAEIIEKWFLNDINEFSYSFDSE